MSSGSGASPPDGATKSKLAKLPAEIVYDILGSLWTEYLLTLGANCRRLWAIMKQLLVQRLMESLGTRASTPVVCVSGSNIAGKDAPCPPILFWSEDLDELYTSGWRGTTEGHWGSSRPGYREDLEGKFGENCRTHIPNVGEWANKSIDSYAGCGRKLELWASIWPAGG